MAMKTVNSALPMESSPCLDCRHFIAVFETCNLTFCRRSSPVYADCVRKKKDVMGMMESKLDSGIDR